MLKKIKRRAFNVLLRVFAMGVRFSLVFFLAKFLTPSELGVFGLLVSTISFCVLLIGADFYVFSHREMLARASIEWGWVVQNHIGAVLLLYIVFLPLLFLLFYLDYISWEYLYLFYLLLIFEHISLELNRLLNTLDRQILSTWVLFIRTASWVCVIVPLMYFYTEMRTIDVVLYSWLIGVIVSVLIGAYQLRKVIPGAISFKFDKQWIFKGLKIGLLFLVSTLSIKALFTVDRYAVEFLDTIDIVGVYVFYIGAIMAVFGILEPAVFSFLYPKLLRFYQNDEMVAYRRTFIELLFSTVIISIVLASFAWLFLPFVVEWIDKTIFSDNLHIAKYLIAAGFLYTLSFIPHYALYAMGFYRHIFYSHVSSLVVFLISIKLLAVEDGMVVVSTSLAIAFLWLLLFKACSLIFCTLWSNSETSNFSNNMQVKNDA